MTGPDALWPAPRTPRGSRIVHSWRCPRTAPIVERVKKLPTGQALVVTMCSHCRGDDAGWRLTNPEPPDAAA